MHILSLALSLLAAASTVAAAPQKGWNGNFKTHIAFGDSYTDESRLSYLIAHNGTNPPVGWIAPDSNSSASGGHSWARYATYYTGATLYNYAVSGAVCSNELTPRFLSSINRDFPDVEGYEVPAFAADLRSGALDVDWKTTVVSLWIGTNDLGGGLFMDHAQKRGATEVDYTKCVWKQLRSLHKLGARNFVLLNIAPLDLSPLYSTEPGPSRFWLNKGTNMTAISSTMASTVASVNEIFSLRAAAYTKSQLPNSKLAILDTNSLLADIYHRPELYLNGTAPLNVTGYNYGCTADYSRCRTYRGDDRDAFMWYDELHPSEQVGRVLAKVWTEVVRGGKKWVTFF
ncbi:GDSL lipase/acylhydrolase family protein [Tricharina praecox]|uniref:GDSL lipase/acylhydrolase family protein n=1 Tax=Tricharina praecox TaxID=43433 RepID=UPI00221EA267|nr:GDSL lipase/acylhydrolase family protein [Tricharina praecox]KAI5849813.1 GDSL lipase/acylhydrolase family protein [Tricharina praecox]